MIKNHLIAILFCLLQAVMVDSSDVSVWFQIGQIALKLVNYPLARHAFEMVNNISSLILCRQILSFQKMQLLTLLT